MQINKKEKGFKVVLVGETCVGKSSIVSKLVLNRFDVNQHNTIGAAFLTKYIYLNDKKIKLELWDTAGQERFNSIIPMYYRQSHAAIVVYDITNLNSFERAKRWIKELLDELDDNIVIALVGNKVDLDTNRVISKEMGSDYATNNGFIFMETSAKTGFCIDDLFQTVGSVVFDEEKRKESLGKMKNIDSLMDPFFDPLIGTTVDNYGRTKLKFEPNHSKPKNFCSC